MVKVYLTIDPYEQELKTSHDSEPRLSPMLYQKLSKALESGKKIRILVADMEICNE